MIRCSSFYSDFREVSGFEGFMTVWCSQKAVITRPRFPNNCNCLLCIFETVHPGRIQPVDCTQESAKTRAHEVTFKTCSVQPSTFCHAPLISLSLAPRLCVSSTAGTDDLKRVPGTGRERCWWGWRGISRVLLPRVPPARHALENRLSQHRGYTTERS